MRCCWPSFIEKVPPQSKTSGSDFSAEIYLVVVPADNSGMHLPRHIFAIERMPPDVLCAWAVNNHCRWCSNTPEFFIRYRIPPRNAKRFELACIQHAREASSRTGYSFKGEYSTASIESSPIGQAIRIGTRVTVL